MPASRQLSALELAILGGALSTGETLESLATKAGVDATDLQGVFKMQGLNIPTAAASKLSAEEQAAYLGALTSGTPASQLPSQYGFTSQSMLDRLRESELLIPLNTDEMNAYSIAYDEGLTAEQAAERFGVSTDYVNTGLAAAGLTLSGKKPTAPKTPQIGSNNPSNAFGQTPNYGTASSIFGMIPQIPSLRMVSKNANRERDPNWMGTTDTILTSSRGLQTDPNISVKTLLGS